MKGFRRSRRGVTATFGPAEAALVHVLVGDLLALLESDRAPQAEVADVDPLVALTGLDTAAVDPGPPDDPVLARLFPEAYRLDTDPGQAESAADYRRFTSAELHEVKEAGLRLVQSTLPAEGGQVVLDDDTAQAWMTALTDLRLALGTRLGVSEAMLDHPVPPDDPRAPALEVFDFLGWLQETLVQAVAGW